MAENNLSLKSISELLQYSFFIPSYQRGYRWTTQQVEDLLNDISDFSPKDINNSDEKTWYCLQPLVVKKCNAKYRNEFKLDSLKEWYEVIDGQQRLTTIFLLVRYINDVWKGKQKLQEVKLKYQTREKSEEFLKHLQIDGTHKDLSDNNIDFHHISLAYEIINKWFTERTNFDTSNFESKLIFSTKVIWYETEADDSIEIFTRINIGKIPLTNAELIKALFLNSSNYKTTDNDKIRLKQLEIASEWDRIEYALQNNSFWYFLNRKENSLATRIEFVFDLMAIKPQESDEYFTFRYFIKKFKKRTEDEFVANWQEIKRYYQMLEEWYVDRTLYHKVGFLIATGTDIAQLVSIVLTGVSKSAFQRKLDMLISGKVDVQLNEVVYGSSIVKNILLLHNIQTIQKNDKTNRFPFDRYMEEKWDIEHISAVADKMPKSEKHQRDWLNDAMEFLPQNALRERASVYTKETFHEIYGDILNYVNSIERIDDINNISNLALLDATTNRGYGNAIFPVKRKKIILKDKLGTFVPICTKNAFMKFYNDDVSQMSFWDKKDRQAYLTNIKETLSDYLPKQTSKS